MKCHQCNRWSSKVVGIKSQNEDLWQDFMSLPQDERHNIKADYADLKAAALREDMTLKVQLFRKDDSEKSSGFKGEYWPANVWRDRFKYSEAQITALMNAGDNKRWDEIIQDWEYCKKLQGISQQDKEICGKSSSWTPTEKKRPCLQACRSHTVDRIRADPI